MGPEAPLRLQVARALEAGAWKGAVPRGLSRAWGALASRAIVRPLEWPRDVRVIAVGGATLGGSGKTPLAIACARALAGAGARVALVAHGYRARPGSARIVRVDDELAAVGDEALLAARALAGWPRARVVVAPSRQAGIDLAAQRADVLVLDGVLQTAPRRASLALLALDGARPWGAGELPPRGDLRAPRASLLAACDRAVLVQDVRARGAHVADRLLPWAELAPLRVGLFVALARPDRVLASLARHGVFPVAVVAAPDHGPPPASLAARLARSAVDLWLATPKCALHLEAATLPHAVLEHELDLEASLLSAVLAASRRLPTPARAFPRAP